tara:strand:- start:857 stop:1138 length:282 start_codon:yes stop_codon:yes gene_type:complete
MNEISSEWNTKLSTEGIEDVYSSKAEALKDFRRCHQSYYNIDPQNTSDPKTNRKRISKMITLSAKRIEEVEKMEDWKKFKISFWKKLFKPKQR